MTVLGPTCVIMQIGEVGNAATDCRPQIDTIALALIEVGDNIGAAGTAMRVIHKNIRTCPTGQRVIAVLAIEDVVAALAFQCVVAAVAGDDVAKF